jgi:hypothetical protein
MKGLTLWTGLGAVMLAFTSTAGAQWSDDFEAYANNAFLLANTAPPAGIMGQGSWEQWDDGTTTQTKVKGVAQGAAVRSGVNSIWVRGSSDSIVQFNGNAPASANNPGGPYTSGQWSLGAWMYIPVTTTGFTYSTASDSFFLIQNEYNHNGPYNWSLQLHFQGATGMYVADWASTSSYTGPYIPDQWVEVRADIDLTLDQIEVFYDGTSIGAPLPYNGAVSGVGTGSTAIGALDLYANGAADPVSRVYYDDAFLTGGGGGCNSNPTNYCTAGTSASGCQAFIVATGTASASASSGFNVSVSNFEGNKDGIFFYAQNGKQANSWGNGTSYQCVVPPVKRAGTQTGIGTNNACNNIASQDLNSYWNANPAKAPAAGLPVQIQFWHRDPQNTSNQTTSLSDAVEALVCP